MLTQVRRLSLRYDHVTCPVMCLRLAAIALLVLQSEEDAFWCLVAVVEAIMPPDYYTKNLVASQVRAQSHLFTCSPVQLG